MIDLWKGYCRKWPICSIEDGLAEDDWDGWIKLKRAARRSLVGDDCSSPTSSGCKDGIDKKAGNSILIKVNQIGTLSETLDAIDLAKRHHGVPASHRRDRGRHHRGHRRCQYGQIKTGSTSRSDRIAIQSIAADRGRPGRRGAV